MIQNADLNELLNWTFITSCKQCNRVHTRRGKICQECENYNQKILRKEEENVSNSKEKR